MKSESRRRISYVNTDERYNAVARSERLDATNLGSKEATHSQSAAGSEYVVREQHNFYIKQSISLRAVLSLERPVNHLRAVR